MSLSKTIREEKTQAKTKQTQLHIIEVTPSISASLYPHDTLCTSIENQNGNFMSTIIKDGPMSTCCSIAGFVLLCLPFNYR